MDLDDPTESTFKDVISTEVRDINAESTLDERSNTTENNSLKDDITTNDCNDNPRKKEEDILNDGVNEISVTPISNKEKICTVVNEDSVGASVDNEENVRVVNEESTLNVSKEEGIITNAADKVKPSKADDLVSMDVEKCETSKQNASDIDLHLDANHSVYRSGNVANELTSDSESDSSSSLSSTSSSDNEEPAKPNVTEKIPE